jgi:NADPH:quinone reductase-like Zn-dependent oxidoreductase
MKAVGVTGPDFEPRLFDIDEPAPSHDRVVVEVMAASVNEFDLAAARGHYDRQEDRLAPVLLGRDFVGPSLAAVSVVGSSKLLVNTVRYG